MVLTCTSALLCAVQGRVALVQELITFWLCWIWLGSDSRRFQNCAVSFSKGKCAGSDCVHNFFLISDRIQPLAQLSLEVCVKSFRRGITPIFIAVAVVLVLALATSAQQVDPKTYGGMKWRLVGPFRGG